MLLEKARLFTMGESCRHCHLQCLIVYIKERLLLRSSRPALLAFSRFPPSALYWRLISVIIYECSICSSTRRSCFSYGPTNGLVDRKNMLYNMLFFPSYCEFSLPFSICLSLHSSFPVCICVCVSKQGLMGCFTTFSWNRVTFSLLQMSWYFQTA